MENRWGTVCGDWSSWDNNDATVACRQLGFTKMITHWLYGKGKGRVWLDRMRCSGTEASLGSCSHDGWGEVSSTCNGHVYDGGVVCNDYLLENKGLKLCTIF